MKTVLTASLLLAIWYVLSGRFDLLHMGLGIITATVIAANYSAAEDRTRFRLLRFFLYVPWLTVQVVRSNLRVARAVLRRRLDIAPTFISRAPDVTGDRALTTLGASTTLTPGTLTVDVGDHEILIHALDRRSARDVDQGVIPKRVARVFEVRPG